MTHLGPMHDRMETQQSFVVRRKDGTSLDFYGNLPHSTHNGSNESKPPIGPNVITPGHGNLDTEKRIWSTT